MHDATLLVPGTQASCLADQNGVTVWNAVRVSLGLQKNDLGGRPPAEWQALLSMEHRPGQDAPVRTSLLAGTELHPSKVVLAPYDRLARMATLWPYDWRGDIYHNAALLLDWLDARKPASGRWNLVGHSQGCLVIVVASKLAGPDVFARLVGRVALVAGPLAGTMRAAQALLWGRADLGPGMRPVALAMARTWPALFQMLPTWPAIVTPAGQPLPGDRQLTGAGGWPNPPRVEPDLVHRAVRLHQELGTTPFSGLAGVKTFTILGKRQDTPLRAVRDGDAFAEPTGPGEPGDDLVPFQHTLDWADAAVRSTVIGLEGKPREHSFLCQDETVVAVIRRLLSMQPPAAPPPPPLPHPA
jgi:hypothetical protein